MNASKALLIMSVGISIGLAPAVTFAVQGLDARGNQKVNNALAKRWSEQAKGEAAGNQDRSSVVNIGSKNQGTCSVNVGTSQQSNDRGARNSRQPKDIVVATKEVINVCK